MRTISREKKISVKAWIIYLVFAIALGFLSSCSTTKGYNYGKHYKKQNIKKKVTRLFDLDNCKKNNHTYRK